MTTGKRAPDGASAAHGGGFFGNSFTRNAAISRIFSVSSADNGARDSWSIHPTFSPTACVMRTIVSKVGLAWNPVSARLSVAGVMPASHAIAECFLPESSTQPETCAPVLHSLAPLRAHPCGLRIGWPEQLFDADEAA